MGFRRVGGVRAHRIPLALAVVLLLAGPPAAASHPLPEKTLGELIVEGAGVALYVRHAFESAGTFESRYRDHDREDEYSWSWDATTAWEGTFMLQGRDGRLSGSGDVSRTGQAALRERGESRGGLEGGTPWHAESATDCRVGVARAAEPRWESARASDVQMSGELRDGGRTLRLTSVMLGNIGLREVEVCEARETRDGQTNTFPVSPPTDIMGSTLHPDFDEEPHGVFGWTLDVPLDRAETTRTHTGSWALPAGEERHPAAVCYFAPEQHSTPRGSGTCRATSVAYVRIVPSPCARFEASLEHHRRELVDLGTPRADAPESWVVTAWGPEMWRLTNSIANDMRNLLLLCGDDANLPDPWGDVVRAWEAYREALARLIEEGEYEQRTVDEALAIERQLQLMGGGDGADASGRIASALERDGNAGFTAPPASATRGTLTLQVHSPVSIHAWTEEGRHVGWDDAAGRPEVGIDGATYEGAPGGFQRITLPAGFYRFHADGLDTGTYFLNVTWTDETGLAGGEAWPLRSRAGETLATHYALEPQRDATSLAAATFPVRLIETPETWRFADRAPPAAPPPAPPPASGAPPVTDDGANDTPGPGALVALCAAALGAVAFRRRPRA